jgi:ABC-2 type transport system permease protein
MNRFGWMMRRELWEHRAIWAAPLVVLALLLLGALAGNIFETRIQIDADSVESGQADGHTSDPESSGTVGAQIQVVGPGEAVAAVSEEKRVGVLAVIYAGVSAAMFMVLGIIGFFYALDALYADRRDRSVLFWKSLPLSDTETVLSKFCVAAVLIPLIAAAAAIAGQLIVAVGGSIKLELTGGDGGMMLMPEVLGGGALAAVLLAVVSALWYAPVTAYLLLASAWAPKSPFLWAVLPPIALSMLEKIAFGSNYVGQFLKDRMLAPIVTLFDDARIGDGPPQAFDIAGNISGLLTSPGMLLGLVAAAALLAGVVSLRRYRDETT